MADPLKRMHEYRVWKNMINRCTSKLCKAYPRYGGRGISVCAAWRESFPSFLADMGECPTGSQLDRTDNDGNYEPGNCRWVSHKENSRNRRSAHLVTFRGVEMCLSAACEIAGLPLDTVGYRIRNFGWSVERALSTPVRPKARNGEAVKLSRPRTNRTGFRGVKERRGKYVAYVCVAGAKKRSRQFLTPEEAHAWYVENGGRPDVVAAAEE